MDSSAVAEVVDTAIHRVFGMGLRLASLQSTGEGATTEQLGQLLTRTDQIIDELRAVLATRLPEDDAMLARLLRELAQGMEDGGVVPGLRITGDLAALPVDVGDELVIVVQQVVDTSARAAPVVLVVVEVDAPVGEVVVTARVEEPAAVEGAAVPVPNRDGRTGVTQLRWSATWEPRPASV
jgi:hypothetical protein